MYVFLVSAVILDSSNFVWYPAMGWVPYVPIRGMWKSSCFITVVILSIQERFTQDMQPHYIYSPREMTRWVRGIYEAVRPLETLPIEGLVRIWAHEALRLFQDRLVYDEERAWTDENVNMVAMRHFPTVDTKVRDSG